ncbi:hypothetical protein KCU61_g7016, partial [Aureobasidium melanogenum]
MSFNDLPPAILSMVASHLKERVIWLAQYASINRPWQSVVEALTFREIRTESIEHLRRIPEYMNRDRWDVMRSLDVIVHLPEYERERWYQTETNGDKQINNAIFSDFMMKLFDTVNTWEQYRNDAPRFTLAIQAMSMSDYWHLGRLNRMKRYANATRGAEDVRIQASYLRLTGNLPSLSAISGLIVRGARNVRIIKPGRSCCPRLLSGESVCRIVRACPNVNKAEVDLSDQESKDLGVRNAERSAFATSFTGLPQGLRHLKMSYPGVVPANQLFSPPSIPLADGKDFLSYRLTMISRQLQYLEIKAVLSDDFFDMTDPATSWPLLQSLSIDFDPCTPSGDWMLELDPTDSDVEPDHERAYEFEIIFPKGTELNMNYYLSTHLPLVQKHWEQFGLKKCTVIQYPDDSEYCVQAILEWESEDSFQSAMASDTVGPLMDDVKNFVDKAPAFLSGKVVYSSSKGR